MAWNAAAREQILLSLLGARDLIATVERELECRVVLDPEIRLQVDRVLDAEDAAFIDRIADHVKAAVANARQIDELAAARDATERANQELEAFAYSVAHDLRAPLRALDGMSSALLEDHAAKLDGDALHCIQRLRANTERMRQLVDDLLSLSHITVLDIHRQNVDLARIARAVADELVASAPDRVVEWKLSDGLVANADPGLVRVMLENLLANAWKFTSKRDAAHIELGVQRSGSERVFYVRDDGAGFDVSRAVNLFAPFQRFHARTDFDGTGIGLATVQRIVARHGGRIWADARPGAGATFSFTLGR